jgi:hypothetical protein
MNSKKYLTLFMGAVLLLSLMSCKKDKTPLPVTKPETSKWELISGTYKVYDTLGSYLYDLAISHKKGVDSLGNDLDSLNFMNFDGQFDFSTQQFNGELVGWPKNYFYVGYHDPIIDTSNNRWRLMGFNDNIYGGLVGDTIRLKFDKNNIHYYIQDATPYFGEICYQIAVKQ